MRKTTVWAAGAALGIMAAAAASSAWAQPAVGDAGQTTAVAWKGAPQWTNDDVSFKVRGRILVDAVWQSVDRDVGVDVEARSIRGRQVFLGVEGNLNSQFSYKIEGGWVNNGTPAWDDVLIEYRPRENLAIAVGNIKTYGLENLTSTRFRSFMDQGAVGEVTEANYHLGVVVRTWGPNYTLTGAVQGNSINSSDVALSSNTTTASAEERLQYVARATFVPINDERRKLHLGVWARYRDSASDGAFTYETRANTNIAPRFSSTGAIGDSDTLFGVEAMGIIGPFSVQAEFANINVEVRPALAPVTAQDGDIQVGYVYATWWPTGEMRNYDITRGEFGRPRILNPVTSGGWGGVELGLRYDWADLSGIRGTNLANTPFAGEYRSYTAGINYYPFGYVRLMANYTHAEHDNATAANSASEDIFQMRTQLDF